MEFLGNYITYIVTALVVIALLIGAAILLRNFGGAIKGRRGQRLGVSEYYEIDKLRRLVLIRRDDVEHLLLIGGNEDLVVESRILSDDETDYRDMVRAPAPDRTPSRPAPRAPVFGDRAPAPSLGPSSGAEREDPRMR